MISFFRWQWVFFLLGLFLAGFVYSLTPQTRGTDGATQKFSIAKGEGFSAIAARLKQQKMIRSVFSFGLFALITSKGDELLPGRYVLLPMSVPRLLRALTSARDQEVTVTIPEGASLYDVDVILDQAMVLEAGALLRENDNRGGTLEGRLFPDTYRFFFDSDAYDVVSKFLENFEVQMRQFQTEDHENFEKLLVMASLVQNEVPTFEDQRIVAGILKKRLGIGMPLQVDATICYSKEIRTGRGNCYPLERLDFTVDSPYNTYLYRGLPPGPIGNPGIDAFRAVRASKSSPYLYYLSDPSTGETIFSETLHEHEEKRARYLFPRRS